MIAVDTNVLVYAHREGEPKHEAATDALTRLSEDLVPWGLPAPVVGEFLRVATHPGSGAGPDERERALEAVDGLLESPSVALLGPDRAHWPILRRTIEDAGAWGTVVHDAQIVAVAVEHGARELLTEDRGMRRFAEVRVVTLDEFLSRSR